MYRSSAARRNTVSESSTVRRSGRTDLGRGLYSEKQIGRTDHPGTLIPIDVDPTGPTGSRIRLLQDALLSETAKLKTIDGPVAREAERLNRDILRLLSPAETLARLRDALLVLDSAGLSVPPPEAVPRIGTPAPAVVDEDGRTYPRLIGRRRHP